MEGVLKFEAANDNEKVEDWRTLKAEATHRAQELISEIDGLNEKSPEEQILAFGELCERLAKDGNHNRFIAKCIAEEAEIRRLQALAANTNERLEMLRAA